MKKTQNSICYDIVDTGFGAVYSTFYNPPYANCYHDLYNDLFYKEVIFKNKSNGYYVEIGGLDGVVNSQSFIFEKVLGWDGIVVEPNPFWKYSLEDNRKCKISNSAISNREGTAIFECRENHGFSGLKSSTNETRISDVTSEVEVQTITLYNLLNSYNSPDIIDWVSIDTEGAEIDIITKFFEENDKYTINLINCESFDFINIKEIFANQPYFKIKNPYTDFIKVNNNGIIKFNPVTGQLYLTPFVNKEVSDMNYIGVEFEHYYIHLDYLSKNLHLKKYIIN
jgi:FkbM family methyltransferase